MDDHIDERLVGDYRLLIDRSLCVGFGDCVDEAPAAFELDEEGVVELVRPQALDPARLFAACAACPVDALSVVDRAGLALAAPRPGLATTAQCKE